MTTTIRLSWMYNTVQQCYTKIIQTMQAPYSYSVWRLAAITIINQRLYTETLLVHSRGQWADDVSVLERLNNMHTRLVTIHALSCNKPPNSKYIRSLQLLHQIKMEISYEDVFQLLNTGTYPSNCTSNRRRAIRRRASKFSLKSGELTATPVAWCLLTSCTITRTKALY